MVTLAFWINLCGAGDPGAEPGGKYFNKKTQQRESSAVNGNLFFIIIFFIASIDIRETMKMNLIIVHCSSNLDI